jgi:hypothetical protein
VRGEQRLPERAGLKRVSVLSKSGLDPLRDQDLRGPKRCLDSSRAYLDSGAAGRCCKRAAVVVWWFASRARHVDSLG